jgi:hypothetical protein
MGVALEPLKAVGSQSGVARSVLNVPVSEVGLERPRVDPVVCQFKPAGMAEHVSVRLDLELCLDRSALDHP